MTQKEKEKKTPDVDEKRVKATVIRRRAAPKPEPVIEAAPPAPETVAPVEAQAETVAKAVSQPAGQQPAQARPVAAMCRQRPRHGQLALCAEQPPPRKEEGRREGQGQAQGR